MSARFPSSSRLLPRNSDTSVSPVDQLTSTLYPSPMNGSKVLQLIAVVALLVTAFFIGRNSIQLPEPEDDAPAPRRHPVEKLTAIVSPEPEQEPLTIPFGNGKSPAVTEGSRSGVEADRVSNFLGTLADQIGDISAMADTIAAWMDSYPDEAIAWLAGRENRDDVLSVMFAAWGMENIEGAHAWLKENSDMDGYTAMAIGLSSALASAGQAEEALALTENVDSQMAVVQIWQNSGAQLYAINQDDVRQRLASTDLPIGLQEQMIENWKSEISQRGKRNAQNLASVYSSAVAAGANFEGKTKVEITAELVAGLNGSDSFSTTRFQVPNMTEHSLLKALEDLVFSEGGSLNYKPTAEADR